MKTIQISFRMHAELADQTADMAKLQRMTRAAYVREAVREKNERSLLITDPGPMGVLRAISETLSERLTLPMDVVARETIGPEAFARIQESLHA